MASYNVLPSATEVPDGIIGEWFKYRTEAEARKQALLATHPVVRIIRWENH